ncbi:aldo/keto reductase, partial [Corallococcus llansteffanensis]
AQFERPAMALPPPEPSFQGRASPEATAGYARRLQGVTHPHHFRDARDLQVSSIGIGTYLGPATAETDASYVGAIGRALELGCNFIDTAINYRHQRGERCVGAALRTAITQGAVRREEVVVATKAGYLPFDSEPPQDTGRYVHEHYIATGLARAEDIVGSSHCIAPAFLRNQIEVSRGNLGLGTLDVYYLHNPEEQLRSVDRDTFRRRMRAAMTTLEEACTAGHIGSYGLATWLAFRETAEHPQALSLEEVLSWASEVGGPDHHLRFLQLPLNLKAIEAFMLANQSHQGRWVTLLQAAAAHGLHVVTSAPLLQGRLLGRLPATVMKAFAHLPTDVQRNVQLVRSMPGVGSVLVGMSRPQHVEENLALARLAPETETVHQLFRRSAG